MLVIVDGRGPGVERRLKQTIWIVRDCAIRIQVVDQIGIEHSVPISLGLGVHIRGANPKLVFLTFRCPLTNLRGALQIVCLQHPHVPDIAGDEPRTLGLEHHVISDGVFPRVLRGSEVFRQKIKCTTLVGHCDSRGWTGIFMARKFRSYRWLKERAAEAAQFVELTTRTRRILVFPT